MYLGYASLSNASSGKGFELWNNHRNWMYTNRLLPGPQWLHDCTHCEGVEAALYKGWAGFGYAKTNLGNDYAHPVTDPAPWVNFNTNPFPGATSDLTSFYGFSCISATGVETSTRSVDFVSSVTSGGVLGKTRRAAREMVFTLIATGLDRLAVKAGIEMLSLYNDVSTPADCSGQIFDFYTECPCVCDDLLNLAPADEADCKKMVQDCITPYLRRLKNVRITGGPNVLQWLDVNCGAAATLELTLTAGDPNFYLYDNKPLVATQQTAGVPFADDTRTSSNRVTVTRDPWTLKAVPQPAHVDSRMPMPSKWYRSKFALRPPVAQAQLALRLDAIDDAPSGVRFSVLDNKKLLGSWYLKRIPKGGSVVTNLTTGELIVEYGGTQQVRSDLLFAADGESPGYLRPVGGAGLSLVVDQADKGRMQVSVTGIGVL